MFTPCASFWATPTACWARATWLTTRGSPRRRTQGPHRLLPGGLAGHVHARLLQSTPRHAGLVQFFHHRTVMRSRASPLLGRRELGRREGSPGKFQAGSKSSPITQAVMT